MIRLFTSWDGMTADSSRLTSSAAMRKFSAVSSMSGMASADVGLPLLERELAGEVLLALVDQVGDRMADLRALPRR